MRVKILHAIASGVIVASVLGIYLIPEIWHVVNREGTFGPPISATTTLGIAISVVIIAMMLLSFKFVGKNESYANHRRFQGETGVAGDVSIACAP